MNYQLKEVARDVFTLMCENRPCNCPFRTSFPVEQGPILVGKPPQVAFVNQNCGSQCPLFETEPALDKTEVTLYCGSARTITGVEVTRIPKE